MSGDDQPTGSFHPSPTSLAAVGFRALPGHGATSSTTIFFLCDFTGSPKHSRVLSFAVEPDGTGYRAPIFTRSSRTSWHRRRFQLGRSDTSRIGSRGGTATPTGNLHAA